MRPRALFLNLALLLGSVAFVIAGLEIGLRVTGLEKGQPMPPQIYQKSSDPNIGYELKSNMRERAFREIVTTNSLGFRSPEPDPSKPLLAILGDSMTFGYGLTDNQALGALLAQEFPAWSVQNTAVPGYNLRQEKRTYEKKLRPLDPKALVLLFYWNDLELMEPGTIGQNGNLLAPGETDREFVCNPIREGLLNLIPGKCWLDLHSSTYRAIKKVVSARTEKRNQIQQEQDLQTSPFDEHIPPERLQDYGRELDALVALMPPELPRLFVIWPEKHLHFTLRPQLITLAESRGFKVLDLYQIFGNSPETLDWDTIHPNGETVKTAGTIIAAALRHYGLAR